MNEYQVNNLVKEVLNKKIADFQGRLINEDALVPLSKENIQACFEGAVLSRLGLRKEYGGISVERNRRYNEDADKFWKIVDGEVQDILDEDGIRAFVRDYLNEHKEKIKKIFQKEFKAMIREGVSEVVSEVSRNVLKEEVENILQAQLKNGVFNEDSKRV